MYYYYYYFGSMKLSSHTFRVRIKGSHRLDVDRDYIDFIRMDWYGRYFLYCISAEGKSLICFQINIYICIKNWDAIKLTPT